MYDEKSSIIKYPENAIDALSNSILPYPVPSHASVQLCIFVESEGIIARDFSSYLQLFDQVYGRLDPKGLASYAHRKEGHLEISKVRSGSIEIVIQELAGNAERIAILYLVAKYLPVFVRGLAGAYRDYEEGRFTRIRRKQIRDKMQQDDEVAPLSEHYRNQLVELLDRIFSLQSSDLPGAQRFSNRQVTRVEISIVDERLSEAKDNQASDLPNNSLEATRDDAGVSSEDL